MQNSDNTEEDPLIQEAKLTIEDLYLKPEEPINRFPEKSDKFSEKETQDENDKLENETIPPGKFIFL